MGNLETFGESLKGTIESVETMSLTEYFKKEHKEKADERLKKFKIKTDKKYQQDYDVDRDHLVLEISAGKATVKWFTLYPTPRGYENSNLRKFVLKNELPLTDTKEWVGKPVALETDDDGFLRVAI